jgi:hypothetical protein
MFSALVACAGCVDVSGGAVELKWDIRDSNGSVSCSEAHIAKIELDYTEILDGGPGKTFSWPTRFNCEPREQARTTLFGIKPGTYALSIRPLCTATDAGPALDGGPGQRAQLITVPSPIVRDIVNGEVVDLKVLLITVDDPTGSPCSGA